MLNIKQAAHFNRLQERFPNIGGESRNWKRFFVIQIIIREMAGFDPKFWVKSVFL